MKATSELESILGKYLSWNKARLSCLARMLLAMIAVRTVNLSEVSIAFASKANIQSRYKRLQRFFATFNIDYAQVARWMFKLFFRKDEKVYILLDRTNWQWGKKHINVFMLSVAYEGLAIPLYWQVFNRNGNSGINDQKSLLEKFIKTFGKTCIEGVLADREFGHKKLFQWLNAEEIGFFIRIKDCSHVKVHDKQQPWTCKKLFNNLAVNSQSGYVNQVLVFGESVRLAGGRSERGELMIVATNREPDRAIAIYLRRWEIENLFQSLKGRGFRFEDTHMTKSDRIEKLIAVLSIAFCWAHKTGEWRAQKAPISLKRFQREKRPQYSFFRYGLDWLRECIINPLATSKTLKKILEKIMPPVQNTDKIERSS